MSAREAAQSSSVHHKKREDSDSDDPDALLEDLEDELDNDFDLGGFREKRMRELQAQLDAAQRSRDSGYGRYQEIKVEKDVITTTAKPGRSVVHFFHRDFRRCKIMDAHLEKLAAKHTDTLFLRADVANVPFLVDKLEIKVLPCVIGFVDGVSKMKLVGFEELPGGDAFTTASLEVGMVHCGVLSKTPGASAMPAIPLTAGAARPGEGGGRSRIRVGGGRATRGGGDYSDLDDD